MAEWTKWNGDKLKKLTEKKASEALVNAAESTLGKSNNLVPLDEKTLQETGMTKVNPDNPLEVAISYGGGFGSGKTFVPYAVKWHEVPANFQHERSHNYLKIPFDSFTPVALKKELIKKLKEAWS